MVLLSLLNPNLSFSQQEECSFVYGKESSVVIFSGEAIRVKTKQIGGLKYMIKFKVDSVYKGKCVNKIQVYTSVNTKCNNDLHPCEFCGFDFEIGKRYIVYICSESKGIYETNKCSHTEEMKEGNKIILKNDIGTL